MWRTDYRVGGKPRSFGSAMVLKVPAEVPATVIVSAKMEDEWRAIPGCSCVTDVHLLAENERHHFVQETLRDAGVDGEDTSADTVRKSNQ